MLPQAVLDRPREGMVPDITAPTRAGQPAPAAGAPPPPRRNVMMDVKTLSGAAGLYREGPHARSNQRGAPVAERARKVHVDYVGRERALDHAHSRQADGTPYPGVREQRVAADGRAERARGARDLRARRAPPLGQRVLAVVGARHPRPPARHWEAERRDPPLRPAARVRARASSIGAGRSRGRGCTPAFCVGCAPRPACERRAAAAGWQVALAAAKFARLWNLDCTPLS